MNLASHGGQKGIESTNKVLNIVKTPLKRKEFYSIDLNRSIFKFPESTTLFRRTSSDYFRKSSSKLTKE